MWGCGRDYKECEQRAVSGWCEIQHISAVMFGETWDKLENIFISNYLHIFLLQVYIIKFPA
jgi:hypothetical protein